MADEKPNARDPAIQHGYERSPTDPARQHLVRETAEGKPAKPQQVDGGHEEEEARPARDKTVPAGDTEVRGEERRLDERRSRTGGAAERQAAGEPGAVPPASAGEAKRIASERPEGAPPPERETPGQERTG